MGTKTGCKATARTPGNEAIQNWQRSTGLGSIEAARGNDHVVINNVLLQGEIIAFGAPWDAEAWIEASTTRRGNWTG